MKNIRAFLFLKKLWKPIWYILVITAALSICSVKLKTPLQSVMIEFQEVIGAKHYEIRLLTDEKSQETNKEKIIMLTETFFKQAIPREYTSFQLRAVFSDSVKTSWSLAYPFDQVSDQMKKKIEHSKLIVTSDVRYSTIPKISHPYHYRNNILWAGPRTTLSFIAADPFIANKEVFYQFQRKRLPAGKSFSSYQEAFQLQSIFQNVDALYTIYFYSVSDQMIQEKLRKTSIYVDIKPPQISFTKSDLIYVWEFDDKSLPIEVVLQARGATLISQEVSRFLRVENSRINSQDTAFLKLTATDSLGNQATWENQ